MADRPQKQRTVQAPKQAPKGGVRTPPPVGARGGIPRKWLYLGAAGVAVIVAVVLIVVSVTGGSSEATPETIDGSATSALLDGIPQEGFTLGSPDAPVTLVEWADPQCPFCQNFATEVEPELIDQYVRSGQVAIEFRVFPFIGPDSIEASRYIYAAGLQNKLFDVVDLLYAHQGGENDGWVTEELLRGIGNAVPGLDVDQWFEDARSDAVAQAVEDDYAEAQQRGLQGTPAFVVVTGGEAEPFVPASLSVDSFTARLDEALGQ